MRSVAILSEREEEMIQAVYSFRFLSVKQVARLFFSASSTNYAGEYLKRLFDSGLLSRFPLPSSDKGNREYLYTLSRSGVKYLAGLGLDMSYWKRQAVTPPSFLHLNHTLCVNDVLIAGRLLEKKQEGITLHAMLHEWYLKHTPLMVKIADRGVGVVPDGFLDYRLHVRGATYQTAIWLEIDRGSEEQRAFKRKIWALREVLARRVYREYLQAESVTVALATTAGEKRLRLMRSWVEEELKSLGASGDADVFLLTNLPACVDPVGLFLTPVWYTPYSQEMQPLLDLS